MKEDKQRNNALKSGSKSHKQSNANETPRPEPSVPSAVPHVTKESIAAVAASLEAAAPFLEAVQANSSTTQPTDSNATLLVNLHTELPKKSELPMPTAPSYGDVRENAIVGSKEKYAY